MIVGTCLRYSIRWCSQSHKMVKRKVETPDGDAKMAKGVKSSLERSPTPRITNVTGKHLKIISANAPEEIDYTKYGIKNAPPPFL